MRRELTVALGAPVAWGFAAVVALIVGHSFVLALDLFSEASRSIEGVGTMSRGLEPLLGVVAPTVGAASFCVTVAGPVIAARGLAIERERRTLHALLLRRGSATRVLGAKVVAATAALALALVPALLALLLWRAIGGRFGAAEVGGVLLGASLHILVVAAFGCAAAATTRSYAAALGVTLALSTGSWVIDGASEFAALSWLAPLSRWSLSPHLDGFGRGVLLTGHVGWLLVVSASALVVAWVGLRVDLSVRRRAGILVVAFAVAGPLLHALDRHDGGWDLSVSRRASLPPATVAALREIDGPIVIDVWMNREDGRRAHVQRDALMRLRLAVDDLVVRFPLDGAETASLIRDEDYGLVAVTAGGTTLSTRSTARRELSTLILEAAGHEVPKWHDPGFEGHALVVQSTVRRWIAALVYLIVPLGFVGVAVWLRRRP